MKKFVFPIMGAEKFMPVYVRAMGKFEQFDKADFKGYPYYVVFYVAKGQCSVSFDDEIVCADKNKIVMFNKNISFRLEQMTKKCVAYIMIFGGSRTDREVNFPIRNMCFVSKLNDSQLIYSTIELIYNSCSMHSPNSGYKNSASLYSLIMEIEKQNFNARNTNMESKYMKLDEIIRYMELHMSENVALEDISEHISLSPQYICRLFKDYLRTRPFEYLLNLRISKSKEMLVETDLNISEISRNVGFSDTSYFAAAFKKVSGYTPTEFKERYKV